MWSNFRFYRKLKGGVWYRHIFTNDALEISIIPSGNFWAQYGKLNRYTKVVKIEEYA